MSITLPGSKSNVLMLRLHQVNPKIWGLDTANCNIQLLGRPPLQTTKFYILKIFRIKLEFWNFRIVNKCIIQSQLLCQTDVMSPQQQQ